MTVPASLEALRKHPLLELVLVGDEREITTRLADVGALRRRLSIVDAPFAVSDKDKPARALRSREKSSMFVAVELVQTGQALACVSAGNTGALLLTGRHLLGTLPGIEKPAIVATIPGASRNRLLLDVGANVDCKAEQLFQFAVMGSVLAESLGYCQRARVALLNIGVEDYKGNEQVRAAAALMEACPALDYIGYVEGNDLFSEEIDVVVCDGFTGNVTIKSSAGVVEVINQILQETMHRNLLSRLLTGAAIPLLRRLQERVDPSQFNGASLLGLRGSVIKSHGNASARGFSYAISRALIEAKQQVPQLIAERVAAIIGVDATRDVAV